MLILDVKIGKIQSQKEIIKKKPRYKSYTHKIWEIKANDIEEPNRSSGLNSIENIDGIVYIYIYMT